MSVEIWAQVMGLLPLHLGGLHPYERYLVFAIAFGPFVLLGIVVFVQRRRADAADAAEAPRRDDDEGDDETSEGLSPGRRPAT